MGYDIVYGNPLPASEGIDPGYRQPIYDMSDYRGDLTSDGRYQIPYGTNVLTLQSCSLDFHAQIITGGSSYQQSLSEGVDVSIMNWFYFKASADYKKISTTTSTTNYRRVYAESRARCEVYNAKILQFMTPHVHPAFANAVEQLPTVDPDEVTGNETIYREFIDAFGTHLVEEVNMGGVFSQRSALTADSWSLLRTRNVDIGLAIKILGIISAGLEYHSSTTDYEYYSKMVIVNETISIGVKPPKDGNPLTWAQNAIEEPTPIKVKLIDIVEVLTSVNFPNDTQILNKQAGLKKAIDIYCARLVSEQNPPIDNCDKPIDHGEPQPSVFAGFYSGDYYILNPFTMQYNCPNDAKPCPYDGCKFHGAIFCFRKYGLDAYDDAFGGFIYNYGDCTNYPRGNTCSCPDGSFDNVIIRQIDFDEGLETFSICNNSTLFGIVRGGFSTGDPLLGGYGKMVNPYTEALSCNDGYDPILVEWSFHTYICIRSGTADIKTNDSVLI